MRYIVQDASAKMPASCWGRYRKVAVLAVHDGVTRASMISERSRDVIRIVEIWDKCNVGKTDRCAFWRAYAEAVALAAKLNGARS